MDSMYRHTQVGYLLGASLFAGAVGVSIALAVIPVPYGWVGAVFALTFAGVLFPTLTTEVGPGEVRCTFGPGLIRRRIPLRDISTASVVRSSPFYGWGLRWIPNGWLWNVSGLDAVELQLSSGRRFWIGTDEPQKLSVAISQMKRAG